MRIHALLIYQRKFKDFYDFHLLRNIEIKNQMQFAEKTTKSRNLEFNYVFRIFFHYIDVEILTNDEALTNDQR